MPQMGQAPGMVLPHLGVHRTGPDGAFRHRLVIRRSAQPAFRSFQETGPATRAAEVIGLPVMAGVMRGFLRIDGHPADRVDDGCSRLFRVVVVTVIVFVHRADLLGRCSI